jgi:outer membrane protein OmpA-like peptidoglycan-associated protein
MRWFTPLLLSNILLLSQPLFAAELAFPETQQEIEAALKPKLKARSFTPASRGVSDKLSDDPPKVGALIQFDYNSANIRPSSFTLLQQYAKALQNGLKTNKIKIAGHASSEGEDSYNYTLSYRRAQAVRSFLLALELPNNPEQRLIVEAFGEAQPIASNDNEADREKNRRVEFITME